LPLVHARKRGLNRRPGPPVHDDLVLRDFTAERPNELCENFGGRPPAYFGRSELKPSALKLWITSRTQSGAGERHRGDQRQVRALGREQHHLRSSPAHHRSAAAADDTQLPVALSSLSMARTCTRCTISHLLRGRQDQTRATVNPPRF
jgi:hypothetical protein